MDMALAYAAEINNDIRRRHRRKRFVLSRNYVRENTAIGTAIGIFSVLKGIGTYTYTLTSNPGNVFAVSGTELRVNAALDYETQTYYVITAQADNGAGDVLSLVLPIVIVDIVGA